VAKFPVDAPIRRVVKTFERLGFQLIREGNHIAMSRANSDASRTPLTMPNHPRIKASTLRTILTQASVTRDEFLKAYEES
jgi:predicted RNA binding protein YcfA (HicA-like mRNA interferase family)